MDPLFYFIEKNFHCNHDISPVSTKEIKIGILCIKSILYVSYDSKLWLPLQVKQCLLKFQMWVIISKLKTESL